MRPVAWRVRVKRMIDDWVEVMANSSTEAEDEAIKKPGVMSVYARSPIRCDDIAIPEPPPGVRE